MVIPQEIRKRRAKYIQSNLKEGTNKEQKFMTLKRGKQYRKLYFSLSNMPSSFLPQGPRSCYSWALMFFPALPCCVSFLFLQVGAPLSLPGWPTLTALPCWLALTSAVMPCAFAWSLSWGMAVSILA